MATYKPISNTVPQYHVSGSPASGYYLKGYKAGTTTALSMATDSTGATTLAKCQINSAGYPINGSSAVFIPHFNQTYKLALYTNSTDADADTTGNAVWVVDNLAFDDASSEWLSQTHTPTRLTNTTFELASGDGDQTSLYHVGRRLRLTDSSTLYAMVTAVDYNVTSASKTHVTVAVASGGALSASLSAVAVHILSANLPILPFTDIVYNVDHYGAVGDGSTDDTAAITAAFNAAKVTGGTVFFPGYGPYKFTNLTFTTGTSYGVRIVGDRRRYTRLDCYATSGTAITVGDGSTSNSGNVTFEHIQIFGSNSTNEVDGLKLRNGARHQRLDEVTVENFTKGLGLYANESFLNSWGAVYVLNCYQAVDLDGFNASDIQNLVVENCGPHTSYTHGTIASTEPSVDIQGQGSQVTVLSIESNDSSRNLYLQGAITVGTYYAESNAEAAAGYEIGFADEGGLVKHAHIQNGVAATPPQARYMISFGSARYAKVDRCLYRSPAGNLTNTMYGVDFGTSDKCEANVDFIAYDNIAQETARQQTWKASSKRWTLNGKTYIGTLELEGLARTLLKDYNKISFVNVPMNLDNGSGLANGYAGTNLSANGILSKAIEPIWGNQRVQCIERSAASAANVYYTISSGTLDASKKYFCSSYIYFSDWSTSKPYMKLVNNATTSTITVEDGNLTGGWIRHSTVKQFADAATHNVVFYPAEIGSATTKCYVMMGMIIDLSTFDTDYGTDLASMSVHELEQLINPAVIAHECVETAAAAPTDGTYSRGDMVWHYQPAASGTIGWVCVSAGTPGTWKAFGTIAA